VKVEILIQIQTQNFETVYLVFKLTVFQRSYKLPLGRFLGGIMNVDIQWNNE